MKKNPKELRFTYYWKTLKTSDKMTWIATVVMIVVGLSYIIDINLTTLQEIMLAVLMLGCTWLGLCMQHYDTWMKVKKEAMKSGEKIE